MASHLLVVCIVHVTQLCNFTAYFTVNSLAHAHYYPAIDTRPFLRICPSVSLHAQKN